MRSFQCVVLPALPQSAEYARHDFESEWIADEERREAERRRGEEMRPPPPDWLLQYGLNRKNVDAARAGDCWAATKSGRWRPASHERPDKWTPRELRHSFVSLLSDRGVPL